METLIIKIDTRTKKGKYLFGLITEMAKEDTIVKIVKNEVYNEISASLKEMKSGKRKPINELLK
ncbi:MAG TPA: hypothetical protein DCL77_13850 [Prolixibacteraceae bacterium]|jgi:hypothetical protein|nr:hypothetical protein [Prolixibacteraceae bacterium]